MEAVPRLPMLSFELKTSAESTEFGPKLRQYIHDHYNEDPDGYSKEIHELEGLRASAIHAARDFTGCSTLKKYYCQLHYLTSRFPLTGDSSLNVTYNWYDIYSSVIYNVTDIKYEMASILYNIGALHTDLGAMDARNTPDGMKISCTHFQCAAWAFQHLRDTYPQPRESDLSPTLLTFCYNVSLAQAQECILEKSMTDNRKPTIIAKVAMQVVEYLKIAMKNLGSGKSADAVVLEIVGSKKIKMWQRYCDFKMSYYTAVALLYQGMQAEEQQKMGERLAYYQAAVDTLAESSKMAKNLGQQESVMGPLNKSAQSMYEENAAELIGESLTFSNDVMGGKLTAAQKENEFVYHEKVPPASSLAEVKGASLVKGIPFSVTDPEVAGDDIFLKLVPMEAHQASSLYSEEKAKLIRQIGSKIHEKDEELDTYLASMQLDSLTLDTESETLPQELIECCADLNATNGVKQLSDIMAKISNFYHDINTALQTIKRMLDEEEEKEKEFITIMGKRAPNMIIGELKRESTKYREAHQSAQDNNTALHRAITTHLPNLQLLSKPLDQLAAAVPSLVALEGQGDPAAKQEVKRLLGKVSEMKSQRSKWEDQLRTNIQDDDVTKQLITNMEDMEDFFKNELKKHDKLVSLLEQNMSAQNNILQALSEANAAYATTRRLTNQVQAQRTEMISSLLASYNAYLNILKKAEDAQEFYRKLEGQVNKLASRAKSVCRVQEEEREEVLSSNVKKFTGGSVTSKVPGVSGVKGQMGVMDTSASSASGPKLKDYLQHMKGGGSSLSGGVTPGMANSSAPSAQLTGGMSGYGYNDPSASYTSSVRPAPLGSEGSDPLTSCAGQGDSGGYSGSYGSQTSAYQPSAPSPAPSPAPQSSGSPYKASASTSYMSGQYYTGSQMGASAYSASSSASGHPTTPSSTPVVPPSATASNVCGGSSTTNIPSNQGSTYTSAQAGNQQPNPYTYNNQNPYYGYVNHRGSSYTMPSKSDSGQIPQSYHSGGSPHHSGVMPGVPGQTSQPQQYGYSSNFATGLSSTSAMNSTPGAAASGDTGRTSAAVTSHQGQAEKGTGMGQGYYGYYQQQPSAATVITSTPATVSPAQSTAQATNHTSYTPSSCALNNHAAFPYPYSQGETTSTPAAMYIQAGSSYSSNITANYPNHPSSGLVYSNQPGYPNVAGAYSGPANNTQGATSYNNQNTSCTTGTGVTPVTTTSFSTGAYTSYPGMMTNPQSSTPVSTTATSSYSAKPATTLAPQWNLYSIYPQAGIMSSSTSRMSSSTSRAGIASTNTSQANAENVGNMQHYPYGSATPSSTGAQFVSTSNQAPSQASYSTTAAHSTDPYSQSLQYNQSYSQQQWAQYGNHQPYQPHAQAVQHPQQPSTHPQQSPQHPQQSPQHPQPQVPPQHSPQHSQSVQKQHPASNTQHKANSVPSVTSGISNLDLLSGIELTSPPASQWSPLTPQPVGSGSKADSTTSIGGGPPPGTTNPNAPDVTSAAAAANVTSPPSGNRLPNVVSSNTDGPPISEAAIINIPPSASVSSNILDLTALAKNRRPTVKDPLTDDETLQKLASETERLSKVVEGLDRKSLNGPTNLEMKWKELQDVIEKECGELKVSVARCYPLKNRFADILPYDHTRVTLPSARDDYINASLVQMKSTEESFPLILTQAPMPATFIDFWTMVWEQQNEIIVCLNSEAEVKGQIYWPSELGSSQDYGPFTALLHSCRDGGSPVSYQRVLHVTHRPSKLTRVIIHLHFLGWPPSALPESPGPFLQFLGEVHAFQRQQRNKLRAVVVHCIPGLGRSGVLAVLSAFILELHCSGSLIDVTSLLVELSRQRRGGVQDREHLHFLFSAALYYAQDVLMKRGILTNKATFEEGPREKTHVRHPSADLLSSYDLSRLKSKLGLDEETGRARDENAPSVTSASVTSVVSNGSSTSGGEPGGSGSKPQEEEGGDQETAVLSSSLGNLSQSDDDSLHDTHSVGSALDVHPNKQGSKTSGILDTSLSALAPSLAASLDPQKFKIDPPAPGKSCKITKESFENPLNKLQKKDEDPKDPFSGLDPLWSHKKT